MSFSIMNDRVQLFLQDSQTAINMTGKSATDYADLMNETRINLSRSALQRPEINRAQLAAMLRKALKKQKSGKSQKTYWKAFLTSYVSKNANSNDFSE